jgi:glycerol transport system substrate-binding protein
MARHVAHGAFAAWRLLGRRQKIGYQDAGSWTLMKSTPVDRAKAAWLYAQFVTSKTVDLKKSHVGLTFIRESTINHDQLHRACRKLGGLIEFYRSPARVQWSPTGTNVPDYPRWRSCGGRTSATPCPAEDRPGSARQSLRGAGAVLERLERAGVQGDLGPKMNEPQDASYWLEQPGAPYPKLENEDETPQTVSYDELIIVKPARR